jgi:hypothetical protein
VFDLIASFPPFKRSPFPLRIAKEAICTIVCNHIKLSTLHLIAYTSQLQKQKTTCTNASGRDSKIIRRTPNGQHVFSKTRSLATYKRSS